MTHEINPGRCQGFYRQILFRSQAPTNPARAGRSITTPKPHRIE